MKYVKTISHPTIGEDKRIININSDKEMEELIKKCLEDATKYLMLKTEPKPVITLFCTTSGYFRQFL